MGQDNRDLSEAYLLATKFDGTESRCQIRSYKSNLAQLSVCTQAIQITGRTHNQVHFQGSFSGTQIDQSTQTQTPGLQNARHSDVWSGWVAEAQSFAQDGGSAKRMLIQSDARCNEARICCSLIYHLI
ncbi:MAG: hypothetical protein ACJ74Z_03520, partial [Bryobacteraceae bacterium]